LQTICFADFLAARINAELAKELVFILKGINRPFDAVVAQLVEHLLGKEEVGSSNLLNSSL
jgi:hypothetical protein